MPPTNERKLSHDKIFKALLQLFLQDLVDLLGREIGGQLDFTAVQYLSGESFAELKKDGHLSSDLVASLSRRDRPGSVVIHAETEARFRGNIASRMWSYFTHLSSRNRGALVVPIVIFLRGGPPDLRQNEVEGGIGGFVPFTFRYLSLGLSGSLAEEWLQKPQPLVAALAACMRSRIWDRVEHKLQCMRRALGERDPARQYMLTKVIETYLELNDAERLRYQAALVQEKQAMVPFPLSFEEALVESEARGRALGQSQAMTEAILRLVEQRFGVTPAELRSRLAAISDPGRLREVFDRAVAVQSLDQLDAALAGSGNRRRRR